MEKGSKSGVKKNKKFLIVVIAVLLICVGLSGCTDQSGESKFVGTWIYTGGGFRHDTLHLYSDGVLSGICHNWYSDGSDDVCPGTWEANDTHLILHFTGYYGDITYSYEFTNSDTVVLTDQWGKTGQLGETGIYKKS